MGKYLDGIYNQSIYGDHFRVSIPISINDHGLGRDGRADVSVSVGPFPGGYLSPRVIILQSVGHAPPVPDTVDTSSILYDGDMVPGAVLRFTRMQDRGVVPGKPLFVYAFVSETVDADGSQVSLLWEVRGLSWRLVPADHGGVQAALNSVPRGLMSDGRVYDELPDSPQATVVSSLGYVMDTILTDGESIIGPAHELHPNMHLHLLRSWGMPPNEESLVSDKYLQHRLPCVVSKYRDLTTKKGTAAGLSEYVAAVTGIRTSVVPSVNKLLDRSDSCPDDPYYWPSTEDPGGFSVSCTAQSWAAVPTTAYTDMEWLQSCWPSHRTRSSSVEPPWSDTWGSFYVPPESASLVGDIPPPLTQSSDSWWKHAVGGDVPNTWVHRMVVQGSAEFSSRKVGGEHVPEYSSPASPQSMYYLRLRFHCTSAASLTPRLIFLGRDGSVLSQETGPQRQAEVGAWEDCYMSAQSPVGAAYVAFSVTVSGSTTAALGALSLTEYPPASYVEPRGCAVLMDTGDSVTASGGATMESSIVTMESGSVSMEDVQVHSVIVSSLQTWERLVVAKVEPVVDSYTPVGVRTRVFTSDSAEYQALQSLSTT